ncbi:hypothetical protein F1559_005161 [Cyanidiococcus yangmingshanensis]|uniref:Uncharacterized protein n=1 Tax=Cyanidiococcus yangmingshanensis TaxID=2690220 RepID=A0A7J7IRN4_9RHOD|nr:hypothetical protein F1559_005161 [Cyanidiococcus yangmingshanensis]
MLANALEYASIFRKKDSKETNSSVKGEKVLPLARAVALTIFILRYALDFAELASPFAAELTGKTLSQHVREVNYCTTSPTVPFSLFLIEYHPNDPVFGRVMALCSMLPQLLFVAEVTAVYCLRSPHALSLAIGQLSNELLSYTAETFVQRTAPASMASRNGCIRLAIITCPIHGLFADILHSLYISCGAIENHEPRLRVSCWHRQSSPLRFRRRERSDDAFVRFDRIFSACLSVARVSRIPLRMPSMVRHWRRSYFWSILVRHDRTCTDADHPSRETFCCTRVQHKLERLNARVSSVARSAHLHSRVSCYIGGFA